MQIVTLDILLITGFRPTDLELCLRSLHRALAATPVLANTTHLYIGLNGVSPNQAEQINTTLGNAAFDPTKIHTLSFERLPLGAARNRILKQGRGEWIFFCDDDVQIPESFFSDWSELVSRHQNIKVFGGPNLTPENASEFEKIQGAIIATAIGAGPFRRRYSPKGIAGNVTSASLTLCNLIVRRSHEQIDSHQFPESVLGGEELEYLAQFRPPYFWSSKLYVFHRRRPSFKSFFRQIVKYGVGRTHVHPWAGVIALAGIAAVSGLLFHWDWGIGLVPLYFTVVIVNSVMICRSIEASRVMVAVLIHMVIHFGYLFGLIKGLKPSSRRLPDLRE